jgi:hypothetical protein
MTVRIAERRQSVRVAAAYPISIRDKHLRLLAQGRTANISECGLYMIARRGSRARMGDTVFIEMLVPATSAEGARRGQMREVRYLGQIVRCEKVGQLAALGIRMTERRP